MCASGRRSNHLSYLIHIVCFVLCFSVIQLDDAADQVFEVHLDMDSVGNQAYTISVEEMRFNVNMPFVKVTSTFTVQSLNQFSGIKWLINSFNQTPPHPPSPTLSPLSWFLRVFLLVPCIHVLILFLYFN